MPGEMSGGEETVPPRDQSAATSKRASRTVRMVLAVVVVGLLFAGVVVSCRTVQSIFDCSPPTQGELETQRAFVQAHVSDASEFELGAADCDDNGTGYVYFTTELAPGRAQDAFLVSADCSRYSDEGMDDIAVSCASGGIQVYVFFESTKGKTRGELYMD